ncbi:tetratricopeptide repeat protein [Lacimicrobium sp. SS2-24]|uniref:tetratricopeptide repeat protein n=1 Tax=Lacimicrobium sp. SS2-24 TaxID=2005569 RepID=UPI000B4BD9E0|nr:tetratricopeptide repeat protein [Lacimicrobium sp. SS2-24]
MSVVNKMLQDLESRKQQQGSANYQPPPKKARQWWLVTILPIALLVGAMYWLWPLIGTGPQQPAEHTALPVTESARTAVPDDPVPGDAIPGDTGPGDILPSHTRTQQVAATTVAHATPDSTEKPETPTAPATASSNSVEPAPTEPQPLQQQTPAPVSEEASAKAPVQGVTATPPEEPAETDVESAPAFSKSKTAGTAEQQWQQLKARASNAISQGDDAEAITLLTQMLDMQPDQHLLRRKLAGLLLKSGATQRSALILEQGIEQYPQEYTLIASLARFYHQNGQNNQALNLLKPHQPAILQHPDFIQLRARLAQLQQDYSQAQADYGLLSRYQPDNIKWRLGLAVALDQGGNYDAALAAYRWLSTANTPAEVTTFVQQRLKALGG